MFRHILTTEEIDLGAHIDPREVPMIKAVINKWEHHGEYKKQQYEILIFFLSDILRWSPKKDKFYLDRLHYLLVHGRNNKQLVIIQAANIDDLRRVEGTLLHYLLLHNTQFIQLIEKTGNI